MKTLTKMVAAASIASFAAVGSVSAGTIGGFAGVEGGTAPNADGPIVLLDFSFNLPSISSLDAIDLELAASYGSDLHIALVAPDTTIYNIATGQGTTLGATPYDVFGPFNGGFDGTELGDGGGYGLANVVNYSFAAAGDPWLGLGFGQLLPGGTYAAEDMPVGAFGAGEWRLVVLDVWPSVDPASLGAYEISFTAVPAPGALALLGLAGLVGARRRRN